MGDRSRLSLMLAALAVSAQLGCCHALNNGVGLTPLMGVVNYVNQSNDEPAAHADWHPYLMNETTMIGLADAIVSNGLREKGYAYVQLSGGFTVGGSDSNQPLKVNATRFPRGLAFVGEYIHNLTLKFSIYSSGRICVAPWPGLGKNDRGGMEASDAELFVASGADAVFYDDCYAYPHTFEKMGHALNVRSQMGRTCDIDDCYTLDHRDSLQC